MKQPTQITDQYELVGKTIERITDEDEKMFLFFTDNTFAVLKRGGYEISYIEIMSEPYNIEPNDYNLYELKNIGIISEEEYESLSSERRIREVKAKEQKERELFIKLKEKFANE